VSLYCFEHARTPEQLAEMRRLDAAGICLFCPGRLSGPAGQEMVLSTAHWSVTPNEYPYAGTSLHLLLVPHQHAAGLLELGEEARADFWAALAAVAEQFQLQSYGLGVRNGDCRRTGATIAHVHAHLLVAADGAPPVRMRFSGRGPGPGAWPG
jgi:diadenosine tetraphosphate (Ap4A) HIT family hydrolase